MIGLEKINDPTVPGWLKLRTQEVSPQKRPTIRPDRVPKTNPAITTVIGTIVTEAPRKKAPRGNDPKNGIKLCSKTKATKNVVATNRLFFIDDIGLSFPLLDVSKIIQIGPPLVNYSAKPI